MDNKLLVQLRKKNIGYFLAIHTAHTLTLLFLLFIALGKDVFQEGSTNVFILLAVTTIIAFIGFGIFYRLNRKCYHFLISEEASPKAKADYLKKFHLRGAFLIGGTLMVAYLITIAHLFRQFILVTPFQFIQFYTMGHFMVLMLGCVFYFVLKRIYFPVTETIPFRPITMPEKIVIPLGSILSLVLATTCAVSYRVGYTSMQSNYTRIMNNFIIEQDIALNQLINEITAELTGYAASDDIQSQNPARMNRFLRDVHESKNSDMETLIAITANGYGYTSLGLDYDFSAQPFFLIPRKTETLYISLPHTNIATGREVITVVVPVKRNEAVVGFVGGSITMDTINEVLEDLNVMFSQFRLWILDYEGRIIIHADKSLIGMRAGKTPLLSSDGVETIGVEQVFTARDNVPYNYIFGGRPIRTIKAKHELTGWTLAVAEDLAAFLSGLDNIILAMSMLVNVLAFLIAVPTILITRNTSKSINSAMSVISTLSHGHLNINTDDIVTFPDEMGLLLKDFSTFTVILKNIISKTTETSFLLQGSAEELADASHSLSEGAQSRAAAVEEATAAIEEVTSSVEQIGDNAETQMNLSSIAFTSMEHLKKDIEDVLKFTTEAIDTAGKSSKQAQIGNKMMQDTIAGMDSIDSSTKQIAEMVTIISDISDQVNLLALNASIEAARAGEHGKGFAIVAEEISKLADETATTAKSITDLVKAGLKEVATGRRFVDNTKVAFDNIISFIRDTETLITNIAESSRQQSLSSERVLSDTKTLLEMAEAINSSTQEQLITNQEMSRTIEQINQGTLSEAARSEEIASSAADINLQAIDLKENIKFFTVS